MTKSKFTYRTSYILLAIVVWEIIFWALTGFTLYFFGFFDETPGKVQAAFKNPEYLWLAIVLIPILGIYLTTTYKSNKIKQRLPEAMHNFILTPVSSFHSFLKYFLFRNALICLVFAMAQPSFGTKKVSGTVTSLELVVALDVSNSMNVRDIDPQLTRLDIAKRALIQLVNNLHGEKIGICVFAGGAYVQLPITADYYAAKMFINEIETDMVSNQGTNISEALNTSLAMFSKAKSTRGIILVTDGENHDENPKEALAKLSENNVELCVLGLGTNQGGLMLQDPDRPELGYKTDTYGTPIISRVNKNLISQLAKQVNGYSLVSSDPFPNLTSLLTEINQMKRTKIKEKEFEVKENRYQAPLLIALIFWCLFLVWSPSSLRMIDKIAGNK